MGAEDLPIEVGTYSKAGYCSRAYSNFFFFFFFGYKNGRFLPEAASVCVLLARQLLREGPRGKTKSSAIREQSEGGEGRGEERHAKDQKGRRGGAGGKSWG